MKSYSAITRNLSLILLMLLSALLSTSVVAQGPQPADTLDNQGCLSCHKFEWFAAVNDDGEKRSLYVPAKAFIESVHGSDQKCTGCHPDIEQVPHNEGVERTVDCVSCHEELWQKEHEQKAMTHQRLDTVELQIKDYQHSSHAQPNRDDPSRPNAYCYDCHDSHNITPLVGENRQAFRLKSLEVCGKCHDDKKAIYLNSIHGQEAYRNDNPNAAVCVDCHSAHKVTAMDELPAHRMVTESCSGCHKEAVDGYMGSLHGKLAWHGDLSVPKCFSCHTSHSIQRIDNTASPVHIDNRLETCRQCHEDANEQLIKYKPHGSTSNFEKYPVLWLFGKGMIILVVSVLLFFYLHSMLWFYRESRERKKYTVEHGYCPIKHRSGKHFRRFSLVWRINHWMLALSVMTLVLTGMTVMFPDAPWATWLVAAVGGNEIFGTIHRVAGVTFLLAVGGHTVVVLVKLLLARDFKWFGPTSLLPRWRDWEDMKGQFNWFFGKGPQPMFDRWTYWEKFDYWAVYWGAFVIGTSGLILWNSDTVDKLLPGWVFNIATIAHSMEAFLSVMVLFVVHFFNNHFRPSKFPLDTVMFTGSMDLEELKEERRAEYERLVAAGELEKHLVDPPSKQRNIIFHVIGFSLLSIGLILLALVINGFLVRGFA